MHVASDGTPLRQSRVTRLTLRYALRSQLDGVAAGAMPSMLTVVSQYS
jgi:hypothetical protein